MPYVIVCGDEGVQINEGTRIGVVGAGFEVDGFSKVVSILKKLLGKDLRIAASEENAWVKEKLELSTWEQVNASAQQQIAALADRENLLYVGMLPFADPKELNHEIKGHMVRPQGIHIGTKICFTVGGGEQKYNLGQYVISADWVSDAPKALAESVIKQQVEFYQKLAGQPLAFVYQAEGELGEAKAEKNLAVLQKMGFLNK